MTNISRHDGRIPTNDPHLWAFCIILGLLATLTRDQADHAAVALTGALTAVEAARRFKKAP
ncbi:hypothetical protein [Streptomyces sp. NPDC056069]|uniref:hypothetical protein n=1 Tax=Streptomyces sp. NPDC056069 TaxID=3345702 RepID=UPI0035D6B8DB